MNGTKCLGISIEDIHIHYITYRVEKYLDVLIHFRDLNFFQADVNDM